VIQHSDSVFYLTSSPKKVGCAPKVIFCFHSLCK